MRRALVLAAALAAGCPTTPENGFAVDLTVDGRALDAALRANIRGLEIVTSGAETFTSRTAAARMFESGEERLIYRPVVRSGDLDFAVTARDESGVAVGYGTTRVTLKTGATVIARVALGAEVPLEADLSTLPDLAVPDDLATPLDLTQLDFAPPAIMPTDVTLARSGTQSFTATGPVTWSVEEGAAGGAITAGGSYTAPAIPGVYHVIATATGATLRARVTVLPTMLEVLAGNLGGPGNLDGTGGEARFNRPIGIASDGTDIYTSEIGTHVIRKINIATGVVTLLAGISGVPGNADGPLGTNTFHEPHAVALDGNGNLYVADFVNQSIRKIVIATGVVSTITQPGTLAGPTGLTVYTGKIYIADFSSHTIRKYDTANNMLTTIAGTANTAGTRDCNDISVPNSPLFTFPAGIATDGTNLFVSDSGAIRKMTIASPTTTAITFVSVPNRPAGLAVGGTNLYYAEQNGHLIRTTPIASASAMTVAGSTAGRDDGVGAAAKFNKPFGVAHVGTDTLYVADDQNHAIRKIAVTAASVTTPHGRAPAPSTANSPMGGFNCPTDLLIDETGTALYVSDRNNHAVRKVMLANGEISTVAGVPGTVGALSLPTVTKVNARFNLPRNLARDGNRLFVADASHHAIRVIDLVNDAVSTLAGNGSPGSTDGVGTTAPRFNTPVGLTLDGTGLLIGDQGNTVKRLDVPTGEVRTLWGAPTPGTTDATGKAARFNDPQQGALIGRSYYVPDNNNHTVRAIDLEMGGVTTPFGTAQMPGAVDDVGAAARFNDPTHVLAVPGALLVADRGNHTIRFVRLEDGLVSRVIGSASRAGVRLGPIAAASLNEPMGLALTPAGELVMGSQAEHVVLIAR